MRSDPKVLLVAVDFSPGSDAALAAAIGLARSTGAALHLVHALDLPVPLFNPYAVAVPVAYVNEAREAARTRLSETAEKARAEGITVETHLGEVPAAPTIVRSGVTSSPPRPLRPSR